MSANEIKRIDARALKAQLHDGGEPTQPRPFADVVNFRLPARCLRVSPDTVRRPKRRSWLHLVGRVRFVNLTALVVQLIGGALGGYAAGNVSKEVKLGTIGNTIVGALGGSVCGQLFVTLLGLSGSVQIVSATVQILIVSALVTSAVSGELATILIGFLKSKIAI